MWASKQRPRGAASGSPSPGPVRTPNDAAAAETIAFIVSPAGRAITGSVVNVDFGHDVSQTRYPPAEVATDRGAIPQEERR